MTSPLHIPDDYFPPYLATSTVEVCGRTAKVPSILVDCLHFLLTDGLVEGLFRVSGSARRMREISADLAKYPAWLAADKKPSPHDVAGITKKVLRMYTALLGGVVSLLTLGQMRQIYASHVRSKSAASADSFKSASSTLSAVDEAAEAGPVEITNPGDLADALAHLLVTRNLASKNLFLLWLLVQLQRFAQREDTTRMSAANVAIIFQPYLFVTASLSELQPLQDVLAFLISHADTVADKYASYYSLVGGLEDLDADEVSITSAESVSATSPLTIYSSNQASPSRNNSNCSADPKRRSSISHKFGLLWDNYSLPANRSKRLSLNFSTKSLERVAGPRSVSLSSPVCPKECTSSFENLLSSGDTTLAQGEKSGSVLAAETEKASKAASSNSLDSVAQRPALSARNSSKRQSFIAFFRSNSSVNSLQPQLPDTQPQDKPLAPAELPLSTTADDLLMGEAAPQTKPNLGRRLSLRLKRK